MGCTNRPRLIACVYPLHQVALMYVPVSDIWQDGSMRPNQNKTKQRAKFIFQTCRKPHNYKPLDFWDLNTNVAQEADKVFLFLSIIWQILNPQNCSRYVEVQGFYSLLNSLELTREVLAIKHKVKLPELRKKHFNQLFKVGFNWGLPVVYNHLLQFYWENNLIHQVTVVGTVVSSMK